MTAYTTIRILALATISAAAAGCSNSATPLSTASVSPDKPIAVSAPRIDPACATLASQIDNLRSEGSVDRLEKAAAGKGSNVQVKRASLAKQAELNKANAEFQARCGPAIARPQTAAIAPIAPQSAPQPKVDAAAAAAQN